MSEVKVLRKGQFLFKAGDKIQSVFVIQTGQVNICLQKNNKIFDIMTVGNGYVFADLVVLGTSQFLYSGLVQQELRYTELPLETFKSQYESLSSVNKTFIKTMADRLKWAVNEVKNARQDKSAVPISEESIPRVFGSVFHVLNHKGLKDGNKARVDWMTLRNYSQRIFGESFKRVEQASQILVKLKLAEYTMGRDPNSATEGEETEIQGLSVHDLPALEAFFEFFQYYYYKGGKSELLKYEEANFNTLRLLLLSFADAVPDKFGVASKEFNAVVDFFKDYGVNLGNGHFTALESKGLFCKRKNAVDGKVMLQFDIKEFKVQIDIWALIREIDKLNEKGFVDLAEVDDGPRKKAALTAAGTECTSCHSLIALESKFCSECGNKVTAVKTPGAIDRKAA